MVPIKAVCNRRKTYILNASPSVDFNERPTVFRAANQAAVYLRRETRCLNKHIAANKQRKCLFCIASALPVHIVLQGRAAAKQRRHINSAGDGRQRDARA